VALWYAFEEMYPRSILSKKLWVSLMRLANASLYTIGDVYAGEGVPWNDGWYCCDGVDMPPGCARGWVIPITDRIAAIVTDSRGRWQRLSHAGRSALKSCEQVLHEQHDSSATTGAA
jgi:hypothetical protein